MSTTTQTKAAIEAEEVSDLPEGWADIVLEQIGVLYCGQSPAKQSVNNKGEGTLYVTGPEQWSGSSIHINKWTTQPKRIVPQGCVFITVKGAGVGTIFPGIACAIGRDVYAFKPNGGITNDFLISALSHTIADIKTQAAGDIPGLSKDHLLHHQIGLPPLAEQARIVAKIEQLFTQVDASRERLAKTPKILKYFRQSVLAAACSGRLTEDWRENNPSGSVQKELERVEVERRWRWKEFNAERGTNRRYSPPVGCDDSELIDLPESWGWVSADAVCSQITDGEHIQPRYQPVGFPMLTAKHVRDGFVVFDDAGLIGETDFKKCLERCAPRIDDILIVSVGATTGRAAIVAQSRPFALVRSVLLLRPIVSSRYFLYSCQSPWCFSWMQNASGASAQPHFYIKDARRMPFPLPPHEEQLEIVKRVEALFELADKIEERVEAATKCAGELTQAILAKAFRGELVPTEAELARQGGRDYEPVTVLLERIKSERQLSSAVTNNDKRPHRKSAKRK